MIHAGDREILRLEGDLPVRAQRLVKEWASQYQTELLDMWNRQEFRQLPGLE
jgi:hypothetical protein